MELEIQAFSSSCFGNVQNSNSFLFSSSSQPCAKCLQPGHAARLCRSIWRCKVCLKLDHKARWCLTASKPKLCWAPKATRGGVFGKVQSPEASTETALDSRVASPEDSPLQNDSSSSPSHSNLDTAASEPLHPTPADKMANFPCNPTPFVLEEMHVEHGWAHPAHARVALGGEPPRRHEEYAMCRNQSLFHSKLGFFLKKSQSSFSFSFR